MQLLLTSSLLYMATASNSMLTNSFIPDNFKEMDEQLNFIQNNRPIKHFHQERISNIRVHLVHRTEQKLITLDEDDKKNILENCMFYESGMFTCNPELLVGQPKYEIKLTFHSYFEVENDLQEEVENDLQLNVVINTDEDIAELPLMLMQDDKTFHLNHPVITDFGDLMFYRYQGVDSFIFVDEADFSDWICGLSKQDVDKKARQLRKIFLFFTKHFLRRNYKYAALMN